MTEPGSAPGRDKYSESTLKLSERYGIDPARLDAMMSNAKPDPAKLESERAVSSQATEPTRDWIEERRIQQPNHDASASRHKDTVKIVDPVLGPIPPAAQQRKVREVKKEATAATSTSDTEKTRIYQKQGTSPLTWIIGLVLLGLIALMFFATRGCNDQPAQQTQTPTTVVDTVVKTDTLAMKDTVAVPVPTAVTSPTPSKPNANRTRSRSRASASASSSSRNVALSTTSSFAAQERLAELKADGNTRARIQRVTKNGVTLYQVRTR